MISGFLLGLRLCRPTLLVWLVLAGMRQALSAQELVLDPGFELSTADGTFPDSGCPMACAWMAQFSGPEAAAVCIDPTFGLTPQPAHSGSHVLHVFTGNAGSQWWAAPYQQIAA